MITTSPFRGSTVVTGAGLMVPGVLAAKTLMAEVNGPLPHLFAALTLNLFDLQIPKV